MIVTGAVSRRYAKALLELGSELGTLETFVDEISRAAEAYASSADLRNAMGNPLVSREAKKAMLTEVADGLGLSVTAKHTLLLLGDRRRLPSLPGIAQQLREMAAAKKGLLRAEIISAGPLSDAYYARLQAQLEKTTGKSVVLDKRNDPSLIAGVIARIGDTIYDGSLRSRLAEMKNSLLPN